MIHENNGCTYDISVSISFDKYILLRKIHVRKFMIFTMYSKNFLWILSGNNFSINFDCLVFHAVSALFQPCKGEMLGILLIRRKTQET